MDTAKIENIFKEWQKKAVLTKKGALLVDPKHVRVLKTILSLPGILLAIFITLIIGLELLVGPVLFLFLLDEGEALVSLVLGGILFVLCVVLCIDFYPIPSLLLSKCPDFFETILYPFVEPLLFPFLRSKPILLFHKDHLVVSTGWIGPKEKCFYSDMEKITCSRLSKKAFLLRILFKGRKKPIEVEIAPNTGDVLHLLGSAFQPIFVNEPLCEDMLRLYADMITLGRDPKSQQDGLQCAMKYFSEPKYKDYDYTRRLTELVDTFNQYRAQKRMPGSEDYINRCLSVLQNKGVDYDARLDLLSHLFECAYASEEMVDVVELDRLSHIAYYFRIKEWDFLSLKYSFEAMKQQRSRRNGEENAQQSERYQSAYSNRLREAYKVLELNEKASLEEVKTAYRKLVKTCHPDTLPPNAKDSEREEAAIRFRTVTEAYDFLCEELVAEPVSVAK